MNTPPGILGATLLFWGWQAGFIWLGAMAGLALESARFISTRWNFAQADLDRIWDLCVLLFLAAIVVAFVSSDGLKALSETGRTISTAARAEALSRGTRSTVLVLQWLPLILMPIAIAQAFSGRERMDWSTFSLWLRRKRHSVPRPAPASGLNVGWPYFAACLLAASAVDERTLRFPIGLALLVGWALWARRPRSFPAWAWGGCLVGAVALGLVAQTGLRQLQLLAHKLDGALIAHFSGGGGFNPDESHTMLGAVGRLKLSSEIILRVEADGEPPALLREASYKLFKSPNWAVPKQDFKEANSETNLTTWKLLPNKTTTRSVTVAQYLSGGEGLLAVPHGAAKMEDLQASLPTLKTNLMGVVQVIEGPGLARFRTAYEPGLSIDSPPDSDDVTIPTLEKAAVARIAQELALAGQPAETVSRSVSTFLADNFRYSTWLGQDGHSKSDTTPLTRFLLTNRVGHCEYFATATVMLLRQTGIPARYAVGYSVQEKQGEQWIVRGRHAHAWCLAWIDGAWREVDNTPADWVAAENARASSWEKFADVWSRLWYEFSKWRWGPGEWKRYVLWLLVPLLGLTVWRLLTRKQWSRMAPDKKSTLPVDWPGLDSEFYQIERKLAASGLTRRGDETWSAWMARAQEGEWKGQEELRPLVELHYRLRFDPSGLKTSDRAVLRDGVQGWLAR